MEFKAVFIDTWGWLALGHRKDAHHQKVKDFYQTLKSEGTYFYTTDYVLDELVTLLFRREKFKEAVKFVEGLFQASEKGFLIIERITSRRFAEAWQFRRKFQDKPKISFTDFTSMVVMRERDIKRIVTEDEHFVQVGLDFEKVPE